jgi:hypothetical protein
MIVILIFSMRAPRGAANASSAGGASHARLLAAHRNPLSQEPAAS